MLHYRHYSVALYKLLAYYFLGNGFIAVFLVLGNKSVRPFPSLLASYCNQSFNAVKIHVHSLLIYYL
jgi:hypothetical protein